MPFTSLNSWITFRMAPPPFHLFLQKGISHWGKLDTILFHIELKSGGAIRKLFQIHVHITLLQAKVQHKMTIKLCWMCSVFFLCYSPQAHGQAMGKWSKSLVGHKIIWRSLLFHSLLTDLLYEIIYNLHKYSYETSCLFSTCYLYL